MAAIDGRHHTRPRRAWAELTLVLLVLVAFAPFVQRLNAQGASRYALTAALWDHHTVDINGYPIGVDKAEGPNGELRSDKAPGQPLLAVPVYALGRFLGAEPAEHHRQDGNLGVWWVTLWSSVLPACALVVLMRRAALRAGTAAPTIAAVALLFATTLGALTSQLYGHLLAATFGFGAWYLLRDADDDRIAPWFGAGALVGCSIVTEYTTVLVAVVLAGFALWRAPRRFGWFVLGGIPPGIVAGIYHAAAFGSPWKVGYGTHRNRRGPYALGLPRPGNLWDIFLGDRGLLVLTPILLVALVAAVLIARRAGAARADAVVALVIFGLFLALQSGWANPWGGPSPGPRYMTPALPFLAVPLAAAWPGLRRIAIAAIAWGACTMALPVLTYHTVAVGLFPLTEWLHRLFSGDTSPTIWTMAFGGFGWVLYVVTVLGALALCCWAFGASLPARERTTPLPAAPVSSR